MGTFGTLWTTAKRLWSSVPRWRWLTIAAILCSAGSLLPGVAGMNAVQQQVGGGAAIPSSPPAPAPASTSTRPPGRVSPGAPVDHQAQQRLEAFFKAYTMVENDSAAGARCDARVAALAKLAGGDELIASGAQKGAIKDTRDNCVDAIKESDFRIRAAVGAWENYKSLPSVGKAREAVEAKLTDFDRERNLRIKGLPAGEIDNLRLALGRYDLIMDQAATAEALYRAGDPATLDKAISLASSWTELGKLPFPVKRPEGMAAREAKSIDAMKGAERALVEADHRSQVLRTALGRAQADPKGLAIALASLSPFDQARAKASGVDLAAARNIARDAIPQAIDPAAKHYAAAPTRVEADA